MSVSVGSKINRHAIEVGREVGTMIEVDAAQKILIRLTRATVLSGNHAGHDLDQFRDSRQRTSREITVADHAFRGRIGIA